MPKRAYPKMPALSQSTILAANATARAYKLVDERGLHLLVKPSGGHMRQKWGMGNSSVAYI